MNSVIAWWTSVTSDWIACSNWMMVMTMVKFDRSTKVAEKIPEPWARASPYSTIL